MGRWLTPDAPDAGFICRQVLIPNLEEFVAIVNGALLQLTWPNSFEGFGALTPEETAQYFLDMFETYTEGCPVTIGSIFAHACAIAPTGSLACDGASHLRVDYPDLYSVLATAFHTDADHFVTPDLRGRTVLGVGAGSGLTARALNDSGGEETHQLSVAELASHTHTYFAPSVIMVGTGPVLIPYLASQVASVTGSAGSDTAHNNMEPFRALNYAIWAI